MSLTGVSPWVEGLRRAAIPLGLAVVALVVSLFAVEDLHQLLVGVAVLLLLLAGVIVVATVSRARTPGPGR